MVHHVQQEALSGVVLRATHLTLLMQMMSGRILTNILTINPRKLRRERSIFIFQILILQRLILLSHHLLPSFITLTSSKQFSKLLSVALMTIHQFSISYIYLPVIIYQSNYTGPAYCLSICDEDGWNVQGRYEMILKRPVSSEDHVEWSVNETDKKFICILGLSNVTSFDFLFIISETTFDPSVAASSPGFVGQLNSSVDSCSLSGS